ncbi:MAG TPA: hypothetical protein VM695_15220 [Phycisphaerae bacterium]|nr:hypothetical protein [Phycisphaerae bacterium]
MDKSLDLKLAEIHADPAGSNAFLLADAKDADMAFGMAAPGRSPEHEDGGFRSLADYREHIRENTRQGLLDIMLMSVSSNEVLTIRERLFDASPVTPAIRANDTTDIHVARGASYPKAPARPFRTAVIDHAQCGELCDDDSQRHLGANLGLFSMTFNNDADLDRAMLGAYREFRIEAEQKGFRHFLEIFAPNAPVNPIPPGQLGHYLNDLIARALAGVPRKARPIFLKMVYTGPKAMEELVHYDPHLVPGILGGSAGTTYDAFKLLAEAKAHGARAALFGRKINNAEHQLGFIQFLRWIADGEVSPEEAVAAYHGMLQGLGIQPKRRLEEDMQLTDTAISYAGRAGRTVGAATRAAVPAAAQRSAVPNVAPPAGAPDYPRKPDGAPDFANMTSQQRLAYHKARLDKAIG